MASAVSSLQHVLITGPPGIGKTTLICKVCAVLMEQHNLDVRGFYTKEVKGQGGRGARMGFDVVGLDGTHAPLARMKSPKPEEEEKYPYTVGKYNVDVESFENMVVPLLQWKSEKHDQTEHGESTVDEGASKASENSKTHKGQVLVIDEIGKMELYSEKFQDRIISLFGVIRSKAEHGGVLLATIPVPKPAGKENPLLLSLRCRLNCTLFEVTGFNRQSMVDKVVAHITKNFKN